MLSGADEEDMIPLLSTTFEDTHYIQDPHVGNQEGEEGDTPMDNYNNQEYTEVTYTPYPTPPRTPSARAVFVTLSCSMQNLCIDENQTPDQQSTHWVAAFFAGQLASEVEIKGRSISKGMIHRLMREPRGTTHAAQNSDWVGKNSQSTLQTTSEPSQSLVISGGKHSGEKTSGVKHHVELNCSVEPFYAEHVGGTTSGVKHHDGVCEKKKKNQAGSILNNKSPG